MAAVVRTKNTASSADLKKKSLVPYLLLAPGLLWLALFFVAPIVTLISTATKTPGAGIGEFVQQYRFANYVDAIAETYPQFFRSFFYATTATLLALTFAYPLAYFIAFKSGKWKNTLLVLPTEQEERTRALLGWVMASLETILTTRFHSDR